jgi:hypothetical protein
MKTNKTSNIVVNDLITEGGKYSFANNSRSGFSDASQDFLTWFSKVENLIRTNYGTDSGPYKMIETVNKVKFNGYYQSDFDSELAKLKGALNSCKDIKPNKNRYNRFRFFY